MNPWPPALWSTLWRGVDIRIFDIGDESPLSVADAETVLNAEEKTRAARFRFERDRQRWIRSRALLRMRLAGEPGHANAVSLEFCYGPHGKPEWKGSEHHQATLRFNLSHSGDFAAIAVGPEPVGVDIEVWKQDLPVVELAEYEFRPDEADAVRRSAEPLRLFHQLWTAKEAVMKCCGMGTSLPPGCIRVDFEHDRPVAAERTEFEVLDFPQWMKYFHLTSHDVPGFWTLAAAVADDKRIR